MAAQWPIREVYAAPGLADAETRGVLAAVASAGVPVTELGDDAFRRAAYRSHPDGVLAVGRIPDTSLSRLEIVEGALVLVVEAIEKPGNLGAMLRTADGAGVDAVIAADPGVDPWNPNAVRASQGALFSVPIAIADAAGTEAWLAGQAMRIVAAVPTDEGPSPWEVDLTGPVAIVVGSEHAGVSARWRAYQSVRIPMTGRVDSLNASVAAALLMYEGLRQRSQPR